MQIDQKAYDYTSSHTSSPLALKRPCFGKILWAAGKILKNRPWKTRIFRHLLWSFDQKIAFLARAPPSKVVYIGAIGAFRMFLGPLIKYEYLKIVERGTLWVGRGSNSWGKGGRQGVEFLSRSAPPPLNPPCLFVCVKNSKTTLKQIRRQSSSTLSVGDT